MYVCTQVEPSCVRTYTPGLAALTSTKKASMILYTTLRDSVEANRVTNQDEAYIEVLKP